MFKLIFQLVDFVYKAVAFYVANSPDAKNEADDIIQAFDDLDGEDNIPSFRDATFGGSASTPTPKVPKQEQPTGSGEQAFKPDKGNEPAARPGR